MLLGKWWNGESLISLLFSQNRIIENLRFKNVEHPSENNIIKKKLFDVFCSTLLFRRWGVKIIKFLIRAYEITKG